MFPDNDIRKDQNLYIRELQSTLRDLHFQDDRIPLINIDGVFGPETTAAVKTAQRLGGFSETGRVDYEFWTWLFAVRDVGAEDVETLDLLGRIVRLEDRDSVADAVQTMLGSRSSIYTRQRLLVNTIPKPHRRWLRSRNAHS